MLCEECLHIDIRRWKKEGRLVFRNEFVQTWAYSGDVQAAAVRVRILAQGVEISYVRQGRDRADQQYLSVVRTPCHFGGQRVWFACVCGKRVAILYFGEMG